MQGMLFSLAAKATKKKQAFVGRLLEEPFGGLGLQGWERSLTASKRTGWNQKPVRRGGEREAEGWWHGEAVDSSRRAAWIPSSFCAV